MGVGGWGGVRGHEIVAQDEPRTLSSDFSLGDVIKSENLCGEKNITCKSQTLAIKGYDFVKEKCRHWCNICKLL